MWLLVVSITSNNIINVAFVGFHISIKNEEYHSEPNEQLREEAGVMRLSNEKPQ